VNVIAELREQGREIAELAHSIRELCGDDDLAFVDTLDGATDAVGAAREVIRFIAAMEALEGAAKALRDRYAARAQDFASRQERARNALVQFMGDLGEKSMLLPEGTITRKAGTVKVVGEGDVNTLPAEFVRTKLEIDKAAVKRALEQGAEVPGFSLSNGCETLQIRN
jgi:hypothetical protein